MNWWSLLGSWIVLGMAIAALIFSALCFYMIRISLRMDMQILDHVLKFDPNSQQKLDEIHEEIVDDTED